MTDRELMQQALEALENSYPMQTTTPREHFEAITALREALAEQPAQQVVDSDEKAGAYMEARLWEFIDMAAAWPKASPDPRTWDHVMVYAPKPAQRTWVGLTNDEVNNLAAGCHLGNSVQDAIYKAAAKLREKNA